MGPAADPSVLLEPFPDVLQYKGDECTVCHRQPLLGELVGSTPAWGRCAECDDEVCPEHQRTVDGDTWCSECVHEHEAREGRPPSGQPLPCPRHDPTCAVCREAIGDRPSTQGYADGLWRHDTCASEPPAAPPQPEPSAEHPSITNARYVYEGSRHAQEVLDYVHEHMEHEKRQAVAGPASDDGEGQAWLDELVPPVEGGPRLTPAQQREAIAERLREARAREAEARARVSDANASEMGEAVKMAWRQHEHDVEAARQAGREEGRREGLREAIEQARIEVLRDRGPRCRATRGADRCMRDADHEPGCVFDLHEAPKSPEAATTALALAVLERQQLAGGRG